MTIFLHTIFRQKRLLAGAETSNGFEDTHEAKLATVCRTGATYHDRVKPDKHHSHCCIFTEVDNHLTLAAGRLLTDLLALGVVVVVLLRLGLALHDRIDGLEVRRVGDDCEADHLVGHVVDALVRHSCRETAGQIGVAVGTEGKDVGQAFEVCQPTAVNSVPPAPNHTAVRGL